jgi:hypothetical protein
MNWRANKAMRSGAVALLLAAAACAPALPQVSTDDARDMIRRMNEGAAPVDVCTPEGAALFRSAVRTHAKAMHDAGETWPNFEGLEDGDEVGPDAVVVALGFSSGHIQAGDLQGEGRWQVQRWALHAWPQLTQLRSLSSQVCPEIVAVRRAGVRYIRSHSPARERELMRALEVLEARLNELGVDTRPIED